MSYNTALVFLSALGYPAFLAVSPRSPMRRGCSRRQLPDGPRHPGRSYTSASAVSQNQESCASGCPFPSSGHRISGRRLQSALRRAAVPKAAADRTGLSLRAYPGQRRFQTVCGLHCLLSSFRLPSSSDIPNNDRHNRDYDDECNNIG